jgi:hypothetical protein
VEGEPVTSLVDVSACGVEVLVLGVVTTTARAQRSAPHSALLVGEAPASLASR